MMTLVHIMAADSSKTRKMKVVLSWFMSLVDLVSRGCSGKNNGLGWVYSEGLL